MVSRDWAVQHIHECIVGSPCRFWLALNLGLHAIELMAGKRREDGMGCAILGVTGVTASAVTPNYGLVSGEADPCRQI